MTYWGCLSCPVFTPQESLNPVKKVERLLSLVHTTLSAEQVAFFIVDAQNNSFVCLGGALK